VKVVYLFTAPQTEETEDILFLS